VECSIDELFGGLNQAVEARDLPGMADIDVSMLVFCAKVSKTHSIALTGECSDELFGGYPWFHNREMFEADTFPWIRALNFRKTLLAPSLLSQIDLDAHVHKHYASTLANVSLLAGDSGDEKRLKAVEYLNIKWCMTNLIDRTERMAAQSGFAGRVPYADYRLATFLWNVPWHIKAAGEPKSLLREAFADVLPEGLLNRKKSPFPKTYHPRYEKLLKIRMTEILHDRTSPLLPLINAEQMKQLLESDVDYGKPWYGQLMATPQLIAFYIQLEHWLKTYDVCIQL
jgi:asparagine synthase (glutamine-hydrolysing)